ncbi:unnamed protein product [Protopolystoma xenopodis]|uniref:Uncharacterized protein n=1 Tax=Protopolystoma xenopodis TaxID=117903 RepID=A0A3S5CMY1_9PLAT|nr:unnamed protein product [Protopolystoma xenopodis]
MTPPGILLRYSQHIHGLGVVQLVQEDANTAHPIQTDLAQQIVALSYTKLSPTNKRFSNVTYKRGLGTVAFRKLGVTVVTVVQERSRGGLARRVKMYRTNWLQGRTS